MPSRRRIAISALLFVSLLRYGPTWAQELVVCFSDIAVPPYSYPDKEGQLQYLLRKASARLQLRMRFVYEPRLRCINKVKHGTYPMLAIASPETSLVETFAFPMREDKVDTGLAFSLVDAIFVTTTGSKATWDGKRLSGVMRPLIVRAGLPALNTIMEKASLSYVPVTGSIEQIGEMLLKDRAEVALMRGFDFEALVGRPEFRGKLRGLAPRIDPAPLFVVANKEFAAEHVDMMQAIWREIAAITKSPMWRKQALEF